MYVTVHSVKIGGRLVPPETELNLKDAGEAERLLKLGAIKPKLVPAAPSAESAKNAEPAKKPEGKGKK